MSETADRRGGDFWLTMDNEISYPM